MARKNGSNGQRLDQHDKDILELKQNVVNAIKELEQHVEMHIKDDLMCERFPGSGKPMYTYEDIAKRHNVSPTKVCRIATENGMNRRSKNIS